MATKSAESGTRRYVSAAVLLYLVVGIGACSAHAHQAAALSGHPSATQPRPDVDAAAAPIRIAQAFNDNYDNNRDGSVWDRWDARSKAVISRTEYIRRHQECATAPQGPARVEDVTPGPGGARLVHYVIGGQQLTDYWFYVGKRWEFDLPLSNPDAARLYRLPFAKYAAQIGCQDH